MPPLRRTNEMRRCQNLVVSRVIGPLKERSTFEVVTRRVLPDSVAELRKC